MSNKIVAGLLVALGVGLMGLALLAGRSSLARWSIVPVAIVAVILGARGLRKEAVSTSLLVAAGAAAIVAVMGNFGLFGASAPLANVLAIVILAIVATLSMISLGKRKSKH